MSSNTSWRYARTPSNHPIRGVIVGLLSACDALSVKELTHLMSNTFDDPPSLSVVAYHVRVLVKRKMIVLVNEVQVRSTIEHFYALASGDEPPFYDDDV